MVNPDRFGSGIQRENLKLVQKQWLGGFSLFGIRVPGTDFEKLFTLWLQIARRCLRGTRFRESLIDSFHSYRETGSSLGSEH